MEDSSLDDFFAKKDKSKKKSKVKSVEKEDGTKSTTKKEKKKDKPTKITSQDSSTNKKQERKPDDDEWNDFEEERAVDYSGLRIQNLQQKEDVEKDIEDEEEELDENGDIKEKKDKREGATGPWNKSGSATAPAPAQEEEKKPAPVPASTGKYIPPSQRAAMAAASRSSGLPGKRGKKELPNIRSDVDFPTLSTMSIQDQPNQQPSQTNPSQRSIQETTTTHHRAGGVLTLENKFAVLQD